MDWTFGSDPAIKYPEAITLYAKGEEKFYYSFKETKTANKYKSKGLGGGHYFILKIKKNSATIKEYYPKNSLGAWYFDDKTLKFKIKKRLSKYVS